MKKDEAKKKNDEFLKTCSLQVIEMERTLITQCFDEGNDALEDLEELKARIENYDEKKDYDDGKGSLIQRMSITKASPQTLPKKNLPPERALIFALKSIKSSIDYFEDERELFVLKQEQIKKESAQQKEAFEQSIKELQAANKQIQDERDDLDRKCDDLERKCQRLQSVDDRLEDIEDERNRLEEQIQNYQSTIASLQTEIEVQKLQSIANNETDDKHGEDDEEDEEDDDEDDMFEIKQSVSNDQSEFGDIDVGMLQNRVETLEAENSELIKQCEQHKATMSSLLRRDKIKKFDEGLEEKADAFKSEETERRLVDILGEHSKALAQVKFQDRKMAQMEEAIKSTKLQTKHIQAERGKDLIKIHALEDAMQEMGVERSKLLSKIQDLEDETQMLQFKCQAQQDAIVTVKRGSGYKQTFERSDPPNIMSVDQLEALEDDRERLAARCSSLEAQIGILTTELQQKENVVSHMEKFASTVAHERDHLDYQVKSLEENILMLENKDVPSLTMAHDLI